MTVHGTATNDIVTVTGIPGGVQAQVQGGATTQVTGIELGLDHVVVNGGLGSDIVEANGTAEPDILWVSANGLFAAIGGSPFGDYVVETQDETVRLNGLGDHDTLSATGNLAALTSLVFEGGDGGDTILGGNGADVLNGGPGNDHLDGNQGSDVIDGGADDDTFNWDPGDASDFVEGGAGSDRLLFNGSNIGELIDIIPAGGRVYITRNIAVVVLDLGSTERVDIKTFGGTDAISVGDLSSTETDLVRIDLTVFGGVGGDAAADTVTVNGTSANDIVTVTGIPGGVQAQVQGGATTQVTGIELGLDHVVVNGGLGSDIVETNGTAEPDILWVSANGLFAAIGGSPFGDYVVETQDETVRLNGLGDHDTLSATGNLAALTSLVFEGGDGGDTILGGNGADVLNGGPGNDHLDGNQGSDVIDGGADDDTFNWDPGDASDFVEGGAGSDRLLFNGSNIGELIDIGAPTGRLKVSRNIGNVTVDMGGVETIDVLLRGGGDIIVVNDLSATEVTDVNIDAGGLDGLEDQVIALGTANPDAITVSAVGSVVETTIPGAATTTVTGTESTLDRLYVNGMGGDDTFDVVGQVTTLVLLFLNQN